MPHNDIFWFEMLSSSLEALKARKLLQHNFRMLPKKLCIFQRHFHRIFKPKSVNYLNMFTFQMALFQKHHIQKPAGKLWNALDWTFENRFSVSIFIPNSMRMDFCESFCLWFSAASFMTEIYLWIYMSHGKIFYHMNILRKNSPNFNNISTSNYVIFISFYDVFFSRQCTPFSYTRCLRCAHCWIGFDYQPIRARLRNWNSAAWHKYI